MIVILMGVTGSGKTTIGSRLAEAADWQFADGDDFHSAANKAKMHSGMPLNDADRSPWLAAMRSAILEWIREKKNVVLACSALKAEYREELAVGPEVKFVYLKGSYELIRSRLQARHGHFADERILADQFKTLDEPKDAVVVDIDKPVEAIVEEIRYRLMHGAAEDQSG